MRNIMVLNPNVTANKTRIDNRNIQFSRNGNAHMDLSSGCSIIFERRVGEDDFASGIIGMSREVISARQLSAPNQHQMTTIFVNAFQKRVAKNNTQEMEIEFYFSAQ